MRKKVAITQPIIIEKAIQLSNQDGFQQVSLKKLAASLNIKTPSLYNHISGLKELNELLVIRGLEDLKNTLLESAVGLSGDQALQSMGIAYLSFAKSNPGLYETTQLVHQWQSPRATEISSDIIAIFAKVLAIYHLSDTETTHTIRLLRSLMHGFSLLELNQGFGQPVSVEESFARSMDIILAGINITYQSSIK